MTMALKVKSSGKEKKYNRSFLLLLVIGMIITMKFYPDYLERKIEKDNKLENSENIDWNIQSPSYKDFWILRLIEIQTRISDKITAFKIKEERDLELMFLWDKKIDSELAALSFDIETYAKNNPNDQKLINYSKTFSEMKMNPKSRIDKIKEVRLECLEALRRREFGSFPAIFGMGLTKGFLFNFTFYDMELNDHISTSTDIASSSDFYLYYSTSTGLLALFSFAFSLGILLPWYFGFKIYLFLKRKISTKNQ